MARQRGEAFNVQRISGMLRMAGLSYHDIDNPGDNDGTTKRLVLYRCYSLFVFLVLSLMPLGQLLSVCVFWGDFQVVTINMCIFLMSIDKPIIMYLFVFKRDSLLEIIGELRRVCRQVEALAIAKKRVLKTPSHSKFVARLALIASVLTVMSWLLYPILLNANPGSATFVLNTWYPFDTTKPPLRQIRLSLEMLGILFQGTVGASAYSLLYALTNRWSQSMELLNAFTASIGHLTEMRTEVDEADTCILVKMGILVSDDEKESPKKRVSQVIEKIGLQGGEIIAGSLAREFDREAVARAGNRTTESLLVMVVRVLEGMIRWLHHFQEMFNLLLFILYKTCRYILSISAFQVALITDWNDHMLIKLSITLVTAVIRLYFVCFIGEKLIQKMEELHQAAYSCQWTMSTKQARFNVGMLLMRSQTPHQLMSGDTPLSLATFLTSINDSYSFYSTLRQFNDMF